ncbi:MAG: polysaccharide biosynthesis/export family protein [Pseudomonadota bacterium]
MLKHILVAATLVSLAGCGTVYRSSAVQPGPQDGTNVRVVPVTAETVVQANRAAYQPKTLPAVFSLTAGGGSGLRGAGALPEPTFQPEARPGALALRAPPAVNPGPYAIGVGDVVLLSTPSSGGGDISGLLAAQNARQGYTVQDDGAINIPNVGRVRIAGMTVEAAEDALFQRLVENQFDPTFSLEIAEFNSRRVSIGGAVGAPTVVSVGLMPLTLSEALAAAGGVAVADQDFASVRIYRDGTLYQMPLDRLYAQADLLNTLLVDGDAVFVDTEYQLDQAQGYFEQQITLAQARQQARLAALSALQTEVAIRRGQLNEARTNYQLRRELGADDRDYVYLTGEVRTQSRFALPFEARANLADALFDNARGITADSGDISQIYVLRASADPREFGAVTAWHLDARNAANFALMTRFELRPDDVIFVAQQPITRWNRAVSQLLPSLISTARIAADNG